jgi:hypothetical protein
MFWLSRYQSIDMFTLTQHQSAWSLRFVNLLLASSNESNLSRMHCYVQVLSPLTASLNHAVMILPLGQVCRAHCRRGYTLPQTRRFNATS